MDGGTEGRRSPTQREAAQIGELVGGAHADDPDLLDLDGIGRRAAVVSTGHDVDDGCPTCLLAGRDVPALIAEVRRLRAQRAEQPRPDDGDRLRAEIAEEAITQMMRALAVLERTPQSRAAAAVIRQAVQDDGTVAPPICPSGHRCIRCAADRKRAASARISHRCSPPDPDTVAADTTWTCPCGRVWTAVAVGTGSWTAGNEWRDAETGLDAPGPTFGAVPGGRIARTDGAVYAGAPAGATDAMVSAEVDEAAVIRRAQEAFTRRDEETCGGYCDPSWPSAADPWAAALRAIGALPPR